MIEDITLPSVKEGELMETDSFVGLFLIIYLDNEVADVRCRYCMSTVAFKDHALRRQGVSP